MSIRNQISDSARIIARFRTPGGSQVTRSCRYNPRKTLDSQRVDLCRRTRQDYPHAKLESFGGVMALSELASKE